ncbi:protein of unknown function DUF4455 [Phytophthora cactorum]|nr:protein of unknown function DUF4455 [Phytophthora cactorum]
MFVLTRISDVIPVAPELFDADYTQVLVEEIDRKYANKVIADVGLCITLYDFVSIGDAFVHPSDGTSHSQVEFRLVVFRPFVGEVLKGRIVSCTEEHIRVSMDFVQDIIIPSYALQTPSYFGEALVWKYSEGQEKFYMDLHEEIRFRVTNINFTRVTKTAKGSELLITATTTEATDKAEKEVSAGDMRQSLARRRSSSVDLSDNDPTPSAIHILAHAKFSSSLCMAMMSTEAAATTLKSRAEVQLLNSLNQKKASSASLYLKDEQQKAEDEAESQQTQARNRIAFEALPACSEDARMISEVRQLEDDFFIVGAESNQSLHQSQSEGPSQIELNDVRRRDRHMEAQMQYGEEVKAISEDVEVAIIQAADHVKEVLATIDSGIQEAKAALTDNELLLASDNDKILRLWSELEAVCQRRTDEIAQFAAQLGEIEQSRILRVRVGLQRLTCVLMETAHALPPEVERIIEAEAYEVNTVVISNRRVYADLVARMETANVDVFLNARLAWEQGQIHWRHLRHDDAIATFQATLNSPLFTDPEERQHALEQIRDFQEKVHSEQRLAVLKQLKDAGASLTSDQAKHILTELSSTQQLEEEKNQFFFSELRGLHESKGDAAKALREALRLELHGFGAMAKEGAIEEAKKTLATLLSDDSMEDFFRAAGGLKTELDTLAKQLCVADLIYSTNLEPVVSSVGILSSALPLASVMEKQGKEAERRAVQSTLDKVRKATKGEIMSLLPSLQTQISMLMNLEEMSDKFKAELGDITTQLDTIIREYGSLQGTEASIPPSLSMNPVNSLTGAPSEKISLRPSSVTGPASAKSTTKSSAAVSTALPSKSKEMMHPKAVVTLLISRRFERYNDVLLQTNANCIVDGVISKECDNLIETRQQESRLLVEEMGKRMEQQSAQLHDHVEKLAKFFLRVVLCLEESGDKVHNILREAFQRSSDLLMHIEGEYRTYDKRVSLAADNKLVAIAKQRLLYLQRLCDFFGLRQMNQPKSDDSFNLDYFLSAQHIEQALIPVPPEKPDNSIIVEASQPASADEQEPPEQETIRTASGLELVVALSLATLAQRILVQSEDDDADQQLSGEAGPAEGSSSRDQKELHEDERSPRTDGDDTTEVEPQTSRLLEHNVLEKVQTEFLVLNVPSDTVRVCLPPFETLLYPSMTRMQRRLPLGRKRLEVNAMQAPQCSSRRDCVFTGHGKDDWMCSFTSLEWARMAQIGFQAQLPLQQSLAALQGLEVKAKKRLGVFKGEAMEILAVLRAMTASDINSLLSSCQDFIRASNKAKFWTCGRRSKRGLRRVAKSGYERRSGQKFGLPRRTAQERYRSEMTSQLEIKPTEFNPATGKQEEEVIRDHEVVDEEDRILAIPFLEFADQVSAKCQEETKALYQQEGKHEELPPSGVPAALEEYLSSQLEKARSFVMQQEVSYREQVDLFADLLKLVPGVVVRNLVEQAKQEMRRKISEMVSKFEPQFQSWMNLKTHHTLELRPHLCSPNNVHLLRELEEREKTRSTSTHVALHNIRSQFLAGQIQISLAFEASLIGLCQCLVLLLDSSVLSLDDLKPFSGGELPKLKRKSLKRSSLSAASMGWHPFLWIAILWEEVKVDIQAKDVARQCFASVVETDSSIQDLACVPLASNDGACVALLTPAHRALIRARDSAYADYISFCRKETRRFLDNLHERIEDEVKWTLSWEKGISNMRRQPQYWGLGLWPGEIRSSKVKSCSTVKIPAEVLAV